MKYETFPLVLLVLMFVSSAFAADQIGTVTASGSFTLSETQVPASAARSVPLMNGDKVATTTSTASIMLQDGSRIAVDKDSALRVQRRGEETLLCLEQGAMRFGAAEGSQLVVCALDRRIELQAPSEGIIVIKGPDEVQVNTEKGAPVVVVEDATCTCEPEKPTPFLTRKRAVVTASVGAAAATAISLAVFGGDEEPTSPPLPPRSPVQ